MSFSGSCPDHCPGSTCANGNTDRTLCDGAPIYQNLGGYTLLRVFYDGSTTWQVSDAEAVNDCVGGQETVYLHSKQHPGNMGYAPTAPVYTLEYMDGSPDHISVAAFGGH